MRKWLPQNFSNISLPELFAGAKRNAATLRLPAPGDKTPLPQLPIPRTPFDLYRLQKLLKKMNLREVTGRSVLEVGCGIGDLIFELSKHQPKEIYGVDKDKGAIDFARKFMKAAGVKADLTVSSARNLNFPEKSFDYVFLVHEFQHLPNDKLVEDIARELCRVSRQWVVVVEETAEKLTKTPELILRTAQFYKDLFIRQEGRFHLRQIDYLDVAASRYIFTGKRSPWHWIRWIFSPLLYLLGFPASVMCPPSGEGELPKSKIAMQMQEWLLPLTSGLDGAFMANKGITIMRFERERLFRRG